MPTSWPRVLLGDYVDLLTGYPFKSAHFTNDSQDVRLVKGVNVGQGKLRWDRTDYWPRAERFEHARYELAVGDVVLAMDRPWVGAGLKQAAVTRRDLPALLLQRVARLRGVHGLSTGFLRYLISSQAFSNYIQPIVTGVNVPHISPDQIRGFTFHLPPESVQRRVAAVLGAYSGLIENNLRWIEILEEMAQAVYREWFVNFRYPGHVNVSLVDSPLGPIPEGWDASVFGMVAEHVRVNVNPAKAPDEEFDHYSFAAFDGEQTASVGLGSTMKSGKLLVDQPSVLLAKLNPRIPRVWFARPAGERRSIASSEFLVLRSRSGIPLEYLYAVNLDSGFHAKITKMSGGTSTSHQRLKVEDLMAQPHVIPEERVLRLFADQARPMYELREILIRQNVNLRETRDLLLPKLVSGEIDVSDLDIDTEWLVS